MLKVKLRLESEANSASSESQNKLPMVPVSNLTPQPNLDMIAQTYKEFR
jgi:hypothetical protein